MAISNQDQDEILGKAQRPSKAVKNKVGGILTEASRVDRSAICRSALPLLNRVMIWSIPIGNDRRGFYIIE